MLRTFLVCAGLLSASMAVFALAATRSDLQIAIVATCTIGAAVLFGQVGILHGQVGLAARLDALEGKPPPAD